MNTGVKARWVEALRSGEYEQGRDRLRTDEGYCCLGVLCDISGLGEWGDLGAYVVEGSGGNRFLPVLVTTWAGLGMRDCPKVRVSHAGRLFDASLSMLNDGRRPEVPRHSFAEIADLIEEQL